jgi:hypothetical protein
LFAAAFGSTECSSKGLARDAEFLLEAEDDFLGIVDAVLRQR